MALTLPSPAERSTAVCRLAASEESGEEEGVCPVRVALTQAPTPQGC